MIFADARALLNDVEACFAESNVATSPEDIALLSEWSNSQDAFGERAREVCQKLFDVYGARLSVMNRGVFPGGVYFCGDYNNALFLRTKGMDVTFSKWTQHLALDTWQRYNVIIEYKSNNEV